MHAKVSESIACGLGCVDHDELTSRSTEQSSVSDIAYPRMLTLKSCLRPTTVQHVYAPQGPILFVLYTAEIDLIVAGHGLKFH